MSQQVEIDVYKEWLGIPEGKRPPDHYELLRLVRFEDDVEKVRTNYKKLNAHVRKYATGQYSVRSQELLNELARTMLCLTDPERKREYDEGLGRVFEDEEEHLGRKPMGQVLVAEGHLTRDQLREAEAFADARGLSLRDAVVQMKLVDVQTATQAYAQELGLSFVDLAEMLPDDSVLDKFPRNVVKRNQVLPLFVDDDMLLVACVHEPTHEMEEEVRLRAGLPMRGVMATPLAVNQGLAKYYAPGMRDSTSETDVATMQSAKKGKAPQPRKSFSQLTPEEQAQRKQIGILIMCWATIGAVLIDQFVIWPLLFPRSGWPFYSALVLPPLAIWYVLTQYWKK